MPAASRSSYDEVPYPRTTHRLTHVRRLESLATLFGMTPAPIGGCRVLELGCASGWNLISQAREFPSSEFVGIDASRAQIDEGDRAVAAVGLSNVTLAQRDILAIDASLGRFDYILCHGVYSWVPEPVRAKILEVCRDHLAPSGVALVSYNVYPGWHFRRLVRDVMLFHTEGYEDTAERIGQARAALDFMTANTSPETPYGRMLAGEMELLRSVDDTYLFHDHLEADNEPLYFHEFVARARERRLQYLCDSNFAAMMPQRLPERARKALANAPLVRMEQYVDFLRNTSFRHTLLCHADVPLQRQLEPGILDRFQLALADEPKGFDLDAGSTDMVEVAFASGTFRTNSPLVKAALSELESAWPHALSPDELFERSAAVLRDRALPADVRRTQTRQVLAVALLQTVVSGFAVAHVHPPRLCTTIADKPAADAFARMQARKGKKVTNLRHEIVALSEVARQVLVDLDGKHGIEALVETLERSIRRGELNVSADGEPITSPAPEVLSSVVDHCLELIRDAMLLT